MRRGMSLFCHAIIFLLAWCLTGRLPLPGSGRYDKVLSQTTYHYFLYLPEGYDQQPQRQWPLIIYLHGGDLRGDNLNDLQVYGLPYLIAKEKKDLMDRRCLVFNGRSTARRFVIIFPSSN